jgi:hypothetical protein
MVDALRDAGRVVCDHGVVIDLRPLPEVRTLDVVLPAGRVVPIAQVDTTGRAADDAAADRAVAELVAAGWLVERRRVSFEVGIFADAVEEVLQFAAARRTMRIAPLGAELERARRRAQASGTGGGRLRYCRTFMLAAYGTSRPSGRRRARGAASG